MDEDAALVGRARSGDAGAFGELVRRHQRSARAVAVSLVGDWAEAEDLAQDAFVRAHRNLDLLADAGRFGGWLRQIVFGVSIDWVRAHRPELYHGGDEGLPALAQPGPDALERLERDELIGRVAGALRALPERYRVPLAMYHIDGLSQARVAEALGVAPGTARSLVTRARSRLRALLAAHDSGGIDVIETTGPARADDVYEERPAPRMLHILNGDSTRETLERSSVPGAFTVWADPMHEGPVPSFEVGAAEARRIRARWGAAAGWAPEDDIARTLERWDAGVARYGEFDEAVIWCEHDLFDQLLLVRHLAWFAERDLGATRLGLICIGEWPGMPDFKGLGELDAHQLASLLGTRQRVTQRQLALGRRAWRAFTGADPRAIERVLAEDTTSLPFLAPALRRFLEEYPSTRDGLARTDRQVLELIAAGTERLGALFRALHRRESHFYIGDTSLIARLRRLAGARHPLISLAEGGPRWWETGTAALTDAGRAVLAGRADAVALNGVDEWLGGVRLEGPSAAWRWDGERIVAGDTAG